MLEYGAAQSWGCGVLELACLQGPGCLHREGGAWGRHPWAGRQACNGSISRLTGMYPSASTARSQGHALCMRGGAAARRHAAWGELRPARHHIPQVGCYVTASQADRAIITVAACLPASLLPLPSAAALRPAITLSWQRAAATAAAP